MATERGGFGGLLLLGAVVVALGGGGLALNAGRAQQPAAARARGETSKKEKQDAAAATTTASDPSAPRDDVYAVLERFAGLETSVETTGIDPCARVIKAVGAVCRLGYPKVHVMIATVPDPKDSRFLKFFDDQVSAIRMALERSRFVGDRFYDPWQAEAGTELKPLHWRQPEMLLFRRGETQELLILLLVGETPTWGVHRDALRTALDFANAVLASSCRSARTEPSVPAGQTPAEQPARRTLPILGPAMSGTTESLRATITDWFKEQRYARPRAPRCGSGEGPPFDLEFISGSATVDDNQGTLGHDLEETIRATYPRFRSTFQATVHPETAQQRFVLDYLVYRLRICRIAVLTESSTSYGKGVMKAAASNQENPPQCDGSGVRLTNLPFPLHISKLHGTAQNDAASGAASGVPRRLQALERDEDGSALDAFPAKSRVTQSASEISLEEVLAGIATEDVEAVVIVASSTADVLFLVEKVKRSFPNVTIVVNDADIVFLHDDLPFMESVLSASTYTLSPWTQRLTFPFEGDAERLLFPSSSAKGTYNAALWLIDDFTSVNVVDYAGPFVVPARRQDLRPAQWMTVVSKGAFWPLSVRGESGTNYLQGGDATWVDAAQARNTMWTLPHNYLFLVVSILLLLLDALLLLAYVAGQRQSAKPAADHSLRSVFGLFLPARVFPHEWMHRLELGALMLMAFIINGGFFVVWAVTTLPPDAVVPLSFTLLSGLFGLACLSFLVLLFHVLFKWALTEEVLAIPLAIWFAGAGVAGAWAFLAPRIAAIRDGMHGGQNIVHLMFFIERTRNLDSGVSLLWMALLLGIGHALWVLGHLRQVRIVEDAAVLRKLGVVPTYAPNKKNDKDEDWAETVYGRLGLARPMRNAVRRAEGVLPSRLGLALMALVFVDTIWIARGLSFYERPALDWGCVVAYGMLLAFIVFGCSRYLQTWRALEEVLAKVAPLPVVDAMKRIPGRLLTSFKRPWDACVFEVWQRHCAEAFAGVRGRADIVAQWAAQLEADKGELQRILNGPVAHQIDVSPAAVRPPAPDAKLLEAWEEFLAMRFVAFVQYVRTHLANFVGVTTAALIPALWATNFYPLRQNRFLLILVLAVAAAAIGVTAFVFVQMNRNYTLSRLARTKPGRVTWDRGFVTSLLVHVAIPVLALLAVKFPELGRAWGVLIATVSVFGGGG